MKAIDRLKRDHQLLRSKLGVLEAALQMGPATTWYILRELSFTLSRQLQDHIHREERLVRACRKALTVEALEHMAVEHHDEPELLRTINRLFVEEGSQAVEHVRATVGQLIPRLRHHMDEEEAELFPAIESILGAAEPEPPASTRPSIVREEMTPNALMRQFPATRAAFERLFISSLYEGCDCLDEVAWRHGIPWRDLVDRLERVIADPTLLDDEEKPSKTPPHPTHPVESISKEVSTPWATRS